MPKTKRSKQMQQLQSRIKENTPYLIGVLIGVTLIFINVFIGLSMITLLLDEKEVAVKGGISVPAIRQQDYETVKEDFYERLEKNLLTAEELRADPFV